MRKLILTGAAVLVAAFVVTRVRAQNARDSQQVNPQAEEAYKDMQDTLGIVPTFLKAFPQDSIAGAWAQMKALQLGKNTALNGRTKELIGLAVAAQIPCRYCSYFHESAAKANGATDQEIREAVAMSALTRNFGTIVNGRMVEETSFRRDVDKMIANFGRTARAMPKRETGMREAPTGQGTATGQAPPEQGMPNVLSGQVMTQDVHRDIERTVGFVPGFFKEVPEAALAGLWTEARQLEFNPNTALTGKEKDLIGLAASAQASDRYGIYYHTKAAKVNGATDAELKEAVAISGITRHWSTVLNGLRLDERQFQRETDQILDRMKEQGAPGR